MRLVTSLFLLTAMCYALTATPAEADGQEVFGPTVEEIQKFLDHFDSPLPAATLYYFRQSHPDFNTVGFLAVLRCESGLGTTGGSAKYNNPGNIKYRAGGQEIWHKLATGRWFCAGQGWYNVYPTMYAGQRAAIRLMYDWGYNDLLAAEDFEGFATRYYGARVAGYDRYVKLLRTVNAQVKAWFPNP